MARVRAENNKCVISLNPAFYPPRVVLRAAEEFKMLGEVSVEENNTKVIIESKNVNDLEEVGYQFFDVMLTLVQDQKI